MGNDNRTVRPGAYQLAEVTEETLGTRAIVPAAPAELGPGPRLIIYSSFPPAAAETPEENPQLVTVVNTGSLDGLSAIREKLTVPPKVATGVGARAQRAIEELQRTAPEDAEYLVQRLVGMGEEALATVSVAFPGTLWFSRGTPHSKAPPGHLVSGLAAVMIRLGAPSVPYLTVILESENVDIRYCALLVAAEIDEDDLVAPIGRLLFDDDAELRHIALQALKRRREAPAFTAVRWTLQGALENPTTHHEYKLRSLSALIGLEDKASKKMIKKIAKSSSSLAPVAKEGLKRL